MKRNTSIYTFHTADPDALAERFVADGQLISDRGAGTVSVRFPSDDDVVRKVAAAVGHDGLITTGLGIHRREVTR